MAVTINYRFANTIANLFRSEGSDEFPNLSLEGVQWSSNNVLNRFIKCDLSGPEFEVPVAIRGYAGRELNASIAKPFASIGEKELVVPLIQSNYIDNKRTADSILKQFFEGNIQYGMLNAKTNKDVKYHGGKGYIFDDNFNTIFLATMVGHYNVDAIGDTTDTIVGYTWTECRVYIHPNIIINDSDLLGKGIFKKVLPYLLSSGDILPRSRRSREHVSRDIKVKVIVEDASRFFRTPVPMRADFSNEDLNNMLAAKADEVAKQLKV